MRRFGYVDEIVAFKNRSTQLGLDIQRMAVENWPQIESGFFQLKTLSRDFKPAPPKPHGLQITNPNVPDPGDPVEDLAVLRRKLELSLEDLNHAAKLLAERREAIANLLA
jgi:hypothetical protein